MDRPSLGSAHASASAASTAVHPPNVNAREAQTLMTPLQDSVQIQPVNAQDIQETIHMLSSQAESDGSRTSPGSEGSAKRTSALSPLITIQEQTPDSAQTDQRLASPSAGSSLSEKEPLLSSADEPTRPRQQRRLSSSPFQIFSAAASAAFSPLTKSPSLSSSPSSPSSSSRLSSPFMVGTGTAITGGEGTTMGWVQVDHHQQRDPPSLLEHSPSQAERHHRQSLQTLKTEHEKTRIQLGTLQNENHHLKAMVDTQSRDLKSLQQQAQERDQSLREAIQDRDMLSFEMTECHEDNAKYLKRLRSSGELVNALQEENRHLLDQLREVRARLAETAESKTGMAEQLERERERARMEALELGRVASRYRGEVERLQDLVLAMGNKHMHVQAQLRRHQQHYRQRLQQQLQQPQEMRPMMTDDSFAQQEGRLQHYQQDLAVPRSRIQEGTPVATDAPFGSGSLNPGSLPTEVLPTITVSTDSNSQLPPPSQERQQQQEKEKKKEQGPRLGDAAMVSILDSIENTSRTRRSKVTRRFTVNATSSLTSSSASSMLQGREAVAAATKPPLTVEQRKAEFLLDQITVLQRGFDGLRQEKITLELQLDLLQRQYELKLQELESREEEVKVLRTRSEQQALEDQSRGQWTRSGSSNIRNREETGRVRMGGGRGVSKGDVETMAEYSGRNVWDSAATTTTTTTATLSPSSKVAERLGGWAKDGALTSLEKTDQGSSSGTGDLTQRLGEKGRNELRNTARRQEEKEAGLSSPLDAAQSGHGQSQRPRHRHDPPLAHGQQVARSYTQEKRLWALNMADWDVQQCSSCVGTLLEI